MLKLTEDGYRYISKRGIEYNILEGFTIGIRPRKTTDTIIIMLAEDNYNVEDFLVGWLYGALVFEDNKEEYKEMIADLVDKYEKKNGLE